MIYAKIDDQGNVLEFPYRFDIATRPTQIVEVPADAAEVDVETNKPTTSWDQVYDYDEVLIQDGVYIATFITRNRYNTEQDKLKGITVLKRMQTQQNEKTFAARTADLKKKYPEAEIDSWDQQRRESEAYIADNSAATPLLSVIATARDITVLELATRVSTNATEYDNAFGVLLGKYQKNRDLLNAIDLDDNTTWNNINSIVRL